MSDIKVVNGDKCHDLLTEQAERKLGFEKNYDYNTWKDNVHKKIVQNLRKN